MKEKTSAVKRITFLGLCTSAAIIMAYLESLIPPIIASVPGIKIGLANTVSLFVLYRYGTRDAAAVSFLRIVIVSLLFGSAFSFAYSAAGAFLSLFAMSLLRKSGRFTPVGVSVAGGVFHNVGQILVAIFVLRTAEIGFYMIVLAVSGTLAGLVVGLCAALLLTRLKRGSV